MALVTRLPLGEANALPYYRHRALEDFVVILRGPQVAKAVLEVLWG